MEKSIRGGKGEKMELLKNVLNNWINENTVRRKENNGYRVELKLNNKFIYLFHKAEDEPIPIETLLTFLHKRVTSNDIELVDMLDFLDIYEAIYDVIDLNLGAVVVCKDTHELLRDFLPNIPELKSKFEEIVSEITTNSTYVGLNCEYINEITCDVFRNLMRLLGFRTEEDMEIIEVKTGAEI